MAASEPGDLREFIRTITLRIERAVQAMDRKTDVLADEIRLQRDEMRLQFAQQRDEFAQQRELIDDILGENRAQREALFRILDRLDGGGTAPAA